MATFGGTGNQLGNVYSQILSDERRRARMTESFLADPNKGDKLVATILANISPSGKKPKVSNFSSQTDAYDSVIPEDHPLKSFGPEMKERLGKLMSKREAVGVNPTEVAGLLTQKMLSEPGKSGAPRLVEAMEYKRRADTAWFGLGGEDKSVRKPMGSLYDEWLSGMTEAEKPENIAARLRAAGKVKEADEVLKEANPVATPGDVITSALANAAVWGTVAGLTTGGAAALPAAAIGAGAGALSEIFAKPISKAVTESDWYKARVGPLTQSRSETGLGAMLASGLITGGAVAAKIPGSLPVKAVAGLVTGAIGSQLPTDTGKALMAEMAPYLASGYAFDKAATAAFLVKKAAGKAIAVSPTGQVIRDAADAIEGQKKFFSDESKMGRVINKLFDDTYKLGVNEDVLQVWKDIARSPDRNSRRIMGRVAKEASWHAQRLAENMPEMLEAQRAATVARGIESAEPEEFAAWTARAVKGFDEQAFEDAMRHPEGFLNGIPEAASRQRARMLTDEMAGVKAVGEKEVPSILYRTPSGQLRYTQPYMTKAQIEAGLEMESKVLNKQAAKSQQVIARVFKEADLKETHDLLYTTKAPLSAVEETHEVLYGNLPRVPSANIAAAIDDYARTGRIPPRQAAGEITTRTKALEADPVSGSVLRKTSEPTELGAMSAGTDPNPALPKATAISTIRRTRAEKGLPVEAPKTIDTGVPKKGRPKADAMAEYIQDLRAYSALSLEDATAEIAQLRNLWKSGTIQADEALHRTLQITEAQTLKEFDATGESFVGSKFATEAGMGDWLSAFDPFIHELRNVTSKKAFMALFGVGAGAMTMFMDPQTGGVKEGEAGVFSGIVKGLEKVKNIDEATMAFLKNAKAAGYIVDHRIPDNKFVLGYNEFQRGLKGTPEGGPANIVSNFKSWMSKAPKEGLRHKMMSPGQIFEEATGGGENILNNPAVFVGSYQAAEYNNIQRAGKVLGNVLRDSNIKSAASELREMLKPLNDNEYKKFIDFKFRTEKVKEINTWLEANKEFSGKGSKDTWEAMVIESQKELAEHTAALDGLKGAVKEFHDAWDKVAAEAAKKFPAVRVTLGVGDNGQFEKYSFMKGIGLTPDEKVAVGRLKEQLLQYKQRIKDIGEKVIEGDYVPHIKHPDFDTNWFNRMTGDPLKSAAYMRIFHRDFDSRPMFPDIEATMSRYISDTERRIQNITFWKQEGWNEVMAKSEGIPVIWNAFKALKENILPIDQTFGNKLVQKYSEFEVMKRLFLSPSATLKHLFKQTADIAQRGFSETLEAYPSTMKMLGMRLAEANPKIAESLSKLGFTAKSEQDRLILDYFQSTVPAQGSRKRLLDMGLTPYDEVFARTNSIWNKIQDVGGAGINFAELWDRGLSVTLGQQIAAKKGMTMEQALYGTYNMILQNNFLSRELNPKWLQDPKIRTMALFQATPFKIFERRLVNFIRSSRVIKDLGKEMYDLTKADIKAGTFDNTRKMLRDLRNIHADVKEGEQALKKNLFLSTVTQETDFFGTPILNTFVKDLAIIGAGTYGAQSAGMALYNHFFHFPFLQSTTDEPTLALPPAPMAIIRGIRAWKQREEGDDEFLTTKIFQKWLGSGWYAAVPETVKKAHRISENDIPKIYQDSKFKYLFAIPATKTK